MIYKRLTSMSARRITANISRMDIIFAVAGVVLCSYYLIPTVEAYNYEEQEGTGKRPASRQLQSRRVVQMPGDYPSHGEPQITERETPTGIGENEDKENHNGDGLAEQNSCGIPHQHQRMAVAEGVVDAESEMLKNQRLQTLLRQLGLGSYARYCPPASPQQRRRPRTTFNRIPLHLSNHDTPIFSSRSVNRQQRFRREPPNGGLLPSDLPPSAIMARNHFQPHEVGDPPLETAATNVSNNNSVPRYPPGQLTTPLLHQNSPNGYNDRLGLAFHPPLIIGMNRNSRGSLRPPPSLISTDSSPRPPRNFEAAVRGRCLYVRRVPSRIEPATVSRARGVPYSTILGLLNEPAWPNDLPAQNSNLGDPTQAAALTPEADTRPPSRSSDFVVPRHLAVAFGLPSAQNVDNSSIDSSSRPSNYRNLPTDHTAGSIPSPQETDGPDSPPQSVNSDDTDPDVPSRRHNTNPLQNPVGIGPVELTGDTPIPTSERRSRRADQNQPDANPHPGFTPNDRLSQLRLFAAGSTMMERARGTPPSGIPRLVPLIDPVYGGTRPIMAPILRPRADQELYQPRPRNPAQVREWCERNYQEGPETEGDDTRKPSLRGGEAPNYRTLVPLHPRWIRDQITTNTFSTSLTGKNSNQERNHVVTGAVQVLMAPPATQAPAKQGEDSPRGSVYEWEYADLTFGEATQTAVNPKQLSTPTISPTTSALEWSVEVAEAERLEAVQEKPSHTPLPGRQRSILPAPPLSSSSIPSPPPQWRLPHTPKGYSRLPILRSGGAYPCRVSQQSGVGMSSSRPPIPQKTPPLISLPTLQKLHQPSVSEALPSLIQPSEEACLGGMPFAVEEDKPERGPAKSRSVPSYNHKKRQRKRLTEESLRVWILRQCYLAKLNAAYEEALHEEEGEEELRDLEVFGEADRSFI